MIDIDKALHEHEKIIDNVYEIVKEKLDKLNSYEKLEVGGAAVAYGKSKPSLQVLCKINQNIKDLENKKEVNK